PAVAPPAPKAPVASSSPKAPVAAPAPKAPVASSSTAKAAAPAAKTPAAPTVPKAASPAAVAPAKKGNFLLQLPTLQDRSEADALARRFAAQNAYVVATEVPGKGTVYRVRLGSSYGTMKEAA